MENFGKGEWRIIICGMTLFTVIITSVILILSGLSALISFTPEEELTEEGEEEEELTIKGFWDDLWSGNFCCFAPFFFILIFYLSSHLFSREGGGLGNGNPLDFPLK